MEEQGAQEDLTSGVLGTPAVVLVLRSASSKEPARWMGVGGWREKEGRAFSGIVAAVDERTIKEPARWMGIGGWREKEEGRKKTQEEEGRKKKEKEPKQTPNKKLYIYKLPINRTTRHHINNN